MALISFAKIEEEDPYYLDIEKWPDGKLYSIMIIH